MDLLHVAEVVVESSPNKMEDIYKLLAEGSYPPSYCSIKKKTLKRYARKFTLDGGCLYYVGTKKEGKRKVIVDPDQRRQVFLESHLEFGHHLGQKKTVNRIKSRYYWLGIVKDVIDWIRVCETCKDIDYPKNLPRKCKPVKVNSPWEVLGTSLLGPFPPTTQQNTYVITVTDFFTKWTEAVALPRNDALSVAKALSSIYYRFGAAKNIYFSESWDFCEEVTKHLCKKWNILQIVTKAEGMECTGLNEKAREALKSSIRRVVCDHQSDWDEHLGPVLFAFRTSINPVTKNTPFFLLFNRDARLSPVTEEINRQEVVSQCSNSLQEHSMAVGDLGLVNMSTADKKEHQTARKSLKSSMPVTVHSQDLVQYQLPINLGQCFQLEKIYLLETKQE